MVYLSSIWECENFLPVVKNRKHHRKCMFLGTPIQTKCIFERDWELLVKGI